MPLAELAKLLGLFVGSALKECGPTLARAIIDAMREPNTAVDAKSNPGIEDAFIQAAQSDLGTPAH